MNKVLPMSVLELPKMIHAYIFSIFVLFAIGNCDSEPERNVEYFFKQPIDHFNDEDKRTWQQRYFVNTKYYEDGGPVFLFIGGESMLSSSWNQIGIAHDQAEEFKGALFSLEHRYFGASRPFPDTSDKNITFLTMKQAVADAANFIKGMKGKHDIKNNAKWIVEGCSYAGTLVALLRVIYPEITFGGLSYSGPVKFSLNFKDYYAAARSVFKDHSESCLDDLIQSRIDIISLAQNPSGIKTLHDKFKICNPFDENNFPSKDLHFVIYTIFDELVGVVQFNKVQRQKSNYFVKDICDIMADESIGSRIDRLANLYDKLRTQTGDECLHLYDDYVSIVKNYSYDVGDNGDVGLRQWKYLQCTGWGFFQTVDSSMDMFGNQTTLDFYLKLCKEIFMDWDKELLMKEWSSYKSILDKGLPETQNMIYYWGGYDPWKVSAYKTSNPKSHNIYVEEAAHCAIIYGKTEEDRPPIRKARDEISDVITNWLNE